MSIKDPTQLVDEFKKSGEFDRLRRELLSQFRNDDSIGNFMSRVQDIVQERLREDERLQYLPPETVHNELMQDMDRFPLVQRTVSDLPALTDPTFSASIRASLTSLLNGGPATLNGRPNNAKADADMDDSESSDSDSSEDEHDQDQDQDQEEHDKDYELESAIPDGMPQNNRPRCPETGTKLHIMRNGAQERVQEDSVKSQGDKA